MKTKCIWVIVTVTVLALTFTIYAPSSQYGGAIQENDDGVKVTRIDSVVYDTIKYEMPIPRDSVVVRYETVRLPVVNKPTHTEIIDTLIQVVADSVDVAIPITQKEYSDSTYYARISGYKANLDEIHIYPKTVYRTTIIKTKPKKFGIGVHAGYGFSKNGTTPYVGIGVQYNVLSW